MTTIQSLLGAGRPDRLRRQRGISLLELIAGLAIIAIIIIGALSLVSQADASAKSAELLRGLAGVRANVIGIHKGQSSFGATGTVLNTTLIRARAVPDNWTTPGSATSIRHSYGGAVTVTSRDTTFDVSLATVPVEACIRLISEQAGTSWLNVRVNGGTAVAFPATVANAVTACGTASSTIVFASAA